MEEENIIKELKIQLNAKERIILIIFKKTACKIYRLGIYKTSQYILNMLNGN